VILDQTVLGERGDPHVFHLCILIASPFHRTMQLFEELPTLVAMFFCGVFGYMSVEWLKRRAAASGRHRQKLKGLDEPKIICAATETATTTMNHSDHSTGEETTTQPNHKQQDSCKAARRRNRKVARKACKTIHPIATPSELPMACEADMDSSEDSTTVMGLGTFVADAPPSSMMMPLEPLTFSVHEKRTSMMLSLMMQAEVEAGLAAKIQDAMADNHEHPQRSMADVELVCDDQPVLNPEQCLTEHDKSEVGKSVEEEQEGEEERETEVESTGEQSNLGEENDAQFGVMKLELVSGQEQLEQGQQDVELLQAAQADEEQYHLCKAELDKCMESTDEGSMKDHIHRTTSRSSVLSNNWADAEDEEDEGDFAETGVEAIHHSCLPALDWSASEHGTLVQDSWSVPFSNDEVPTGDSIDGWSEKQNQGAASDDTWMTPFAQGDGEMPGWFADDKWFGQGQPGSREQQPQNSGDSAGWFSDEKWFNEQQSTSPNDGWMTPFDELIQQATSHSLAASDADTAPSVGSPTGSAVCIWKADSHAASEVVGGPSEGNEGNAAAEIFTDGEQVFWSVPSATGQALFTDGKQIYASVCVGVGPPCGADDPASPTSCGSPMCGHGAANPPASTHCSTVSFMADLSDDED